MSRATLYCGHALTVLARIPDESVQCVVTSPPYWGLRDYGVPGQLGLERTAEEYVEKMVVVFAEVGRVLREDGTLWLNIGDCYATSPPGNKPGWDGVKSSRLAGVREGSQYVDTLTTYSAAQRTLRDYGLLKQKDLVGIPWMTAFALRADGWWLRSDTVWSKPNPMPESVRDRPTRSHEYVFLLSKSGRYFYDAAAIRTPMKEVSLARLAQPGFDQQKGGPKDPKNGNRSHRKTLENLKRRFNKQRGHSRRHAGFNDRWDAMEKEEQVANGANARTVWSIATAPYAGAHFATFPEELARRCILAGTSARGHCPECGKPWVRATEREDQGWDGSRYGERAVEATGGAKSGGTARSTLGSSGGRLTGKTVTLGWQPTCDHGLEPVPDVVLDPFGGSGTVALVATGNGRDSIYIDLNPAYLELARQRIGPMFCETVAA